MTGFLPFGARAIMASRQEPPDSLNFFPTPPWATRAFVEHVALPVLGVRRHETVWEPACGEGHMAEPLAETFRFVAASDIHPYGYGKVADFLGPTDDVWPHWVFTNPPFPTGVDFARRAILVAERGAALLVRTQWLHTDERYELFTEHPPFLIAYYTERVPMHRGRWEPEGSTATDYCWVCWVHGAEPRPPMWIPPGQRQRLTRPDDARRFGRPAPAPLFGEGG
ncbi:SAM-dependent DNA methyltransferase [Ancylobacter sp. TS-1]|uniref:SAM-dependent DNA methyltransferase n=1 Tax=Ancylobacter sp. TS-1 TaxID=1850374 RepID=UPI001265AE67|nr:SAM-dependent DNA methyltransferase [Ancylobacter sp. TS-1]QFR32407.1 SAM-dependent DNA methyltransferase [Ancylobacter sp. TS-1]